VLQTTRGIFLHAVKYAETSVIATIYTEQFGRQSFLVNGVRNKSAKIKAAVLQPLYLLDMEVFFKEGREMHRLKDARISVPFVSIPYDIRKSSQAIFLAEVLYKCLREEEPHRELFEFIFHAISFLDLTEEPVNNFHIWFLFNLTQFLGIYPNRENAETSMFFDLEKACFVSREPLHPHYLDKHDTPLFAKLFDVGFSSLATFSLTAAERKSILGKLLTYYKIHFEFFGEIKSLGVLGEVLK
jgi:DNA repair protein RecO (recombination protein O)